MLNGWTTNSLFPLALLQAGLKENTYPANTNLSVNPWMSASNTFTPPTTPQIDVASSRNDILKQILGPNAWALQDPSVFNLTAAGGGITPNNLSTFLSNPNTPSAPGYGGFSQRGNTFWRGLQSPPPVASQSVTNPGKTEFAPSATNPKLPTPTWGKALNFPASKPILPY